MGNLSIIPESSSDVVIKILNMIEKASGWVVNRKTPKKIAAEVLIKEICEMDINPLDKAALISDVNKIIKEYSNQCVIVEKAVEIFGNNDAVSDVEPEWLSAFMDNIKAVSSEELQNVWARILASELEKTGSCSLRTMALLKNVSRNEAIVFEKISRMCISYNEVVFLCADEKMLAEWNVSFSDVLLLEECGFINSVSASLEIDKVIDLNGETCLFNDSYVGLIKRRNEEGSMRVTVYVLTTAGKQLISSLKMKRNSEFFLDFFRTLNEKYDENYIFSCHPIISFNNDEIHYDEQKDIL